MVSTLQVREQSPKAGRKVFGYLTGNRQNLKILLCYFSGASVKLDSRAAIYCLAQRGERPPRVMA